MTAHCCGAKHSFSTLITFHDYDCCGQSKVFNFQCIRQFIIDKFHGGKPKVEIYPRFLRVVADRWTWGGYSFLQFCVVPRRSRTINYQPLMKVNVVFVITSATGSALYLADSLFLAFIYMPQYNGQRRTLGARCAHH